jgi:putative FmdB family regulatory protein
MPTYEYACTSCGFEWEAEQSIKAAALTDCPTCKNASAKRQISRGTGFILKGSGWYSDLYASSKPATASAEASAGSSTSTGGASSGEASSSSGGSGSSGDGGSSGTPSTPSSTPAAT